MPCTGPAIGIGDAPPHACPPLIAQCAAMCAMTQWSAPAFSTAPPRERAAALPHGRRMPRVELVAATPCSSSAGRRALNQQTRNADVAMTRLHPRFPRRGRPDPTDDESHPIPPSPGRPSRDRHPRPPAVPRRTRRGATRARRGPTPRRICSFTRQSVAANQAHSFASAAAAPRLSGASQTLDCHRVLTWQVVGPKADARSGGARGSPAKSTPGSRGRRQPSPRHCAAGAAASTAGTLPSPAPHPRTLAVLTGRA